MKTIGIIGGMSPESTTLYYQTINRAINQRLGGNSSAEIIMHSVNFETVVQLQKQGDWAAAGHLLANSAAKLETAGADVLLLATNTMHKVAPAIEHAVSIPLLHIVDATAAAIKQQGLHTVGLLGTRFTPTAWQRKACAPSRPAKPSNTKSTALFLTNCASIKFRLHQRSIFKT